MDMENTLIKLADLYYLCNDNLKRNSHTIECLFNACDFLNGKFTGDPKNLTVGGHYFRKLVDELLTHTNNKLIKKFPFRFNDLFQAMNKFIELYELRKTEFESIDYKTLRSNFPNFETLYLFNYYDLVFSNTNAVFNNFKEAGIKIKIKSGKEHLLSIPTNATPDEKLNFWLKLHGNNEKGDPYWGSEEEIRHFVNQNFEGFPGVDEIREFTPNMNKTQLYHVTWYFFHLYGKSKTKEQYVNLLLKNFTQFKNAKSDNVYSNIKDQFNDNLNRIFT